MQYFWDWAVRPLLVKRGARHVLEIGASLGGNTDRIVAAVPGVHVSLVDPCLDADLMTKYQGVDAVTVHRGRSLDVLPTLEGTFDAVLIDGDHNYYTVINELRLVRDRLLASGGMILLHDVRDPWARSDLYYEPERIPAAAKEPAAPHGVLTAVEAFVSESPRRWIWLTWRTEHGLACLVDGRAWYERYSLLLNAWLWRSIRWRNRVLRAARLKDRDTILWGTPAQTARPDECSPTARRGSTSDAGSAIG